MRHEQEALTRDFETGEVLKTIAAASRDGYTFESFERLSFEALVREHTIEEARALYNSQASFATFYNSKCNPMYWNLTREGGFELKRNASPAVALSDIFTNGAMYAFECATAMVIIFYKAVLEAVGDHAFNRLFPDIYLWDWNFDRDLGLTWAVPRTYFPGDVRYFKNPQVNPATPYWQGENVVDLGGGLYFGHGLGIKTGAEIIGELNKRRRPGATRSAFLMEEAARPAYHHLSQYAGPREAGKKFSETVKKNYVTFHSGERVAIR